MDFLEYITTQGDRWDLIAWVMYGDPFLFEGILRANPAVAAAPVLDGGITLRVPILDFTSEQPVFAPWQT